MKMVTCYSSKRSISTILRKQSLNFCDSNVGGRFICNSGILFFQMLMNVLATYMTATLMQTVQTHRDPIAVFANPPYNGYGKKCIKTRECSIKPRNIKWSEWKLEENGELMA